MNTGSVGVFEPLGMETRQYYRLRIPLGLSRSTLKFIERWSIKCSGCGRLFSPKGRNTNIQRCASCRIIWRREYQRYIMRPRAGIKNPRKPFQLYRPTGSYIA